MITIPDRVMNTVLKPADSGYQEATELITRDKGSNQFVSAAKGVTVYRVDTKQSGAYLVITSDDLEPTMFFTSDEDEATDRFFGRKDY